LTLSLSALTFHVAQFNTNTINNTVVYADTNEQEIFTPNNGYYENLVLKNGRKILAKNLIIKENLQLMDSSVLAQQAFAIKGMNSATLNIDSTSTLCIGSNDYETTQGFPIEFALLNLHRFSTVLYQSKKDEFINSSISYGNLSIDDGAVAESIKTIENDSLRIRGNLWIAESSVKLKCNLCDIQCQGDWDGIGNLEMTQGLFQLKGNGNNYGILYPGNGEVLYNGEANQIIKIGNYNTLRIKKNGGKTTLKGNANTFICKKLINEKNLLEIGNETVNITDSLINHDALHFTSTQQSRTIKHILNKPTASLIFKVPTSINIKGDWINQGNFSAGLGKIIFSDTNNHQKIIGNNTFNKIEIAKSKKSVELNNDITIETEIKLNSGKLNLQDNTITLSTSSKITDENAQNYIYGHNGKIVLNKVINENSKDTVNGIGLIIQSSANWGNTQFIRKHKLFTIEGQNTVKRQFEIHPANNTNLNENVTFYYLPHELENNNHQQLGLYKSEDELNWQNISGLKDTNLYFITVNGINSFSTWTFKNIPNSPLPVQWLETKLLNQQQTLFWSTASEQNVSYFEIQHSKDGIQFNSTEILKACGTCNYINEYYIELGEQYNNEYLRIKSVDFDGQTSYSLIIQKSINNSSIGIQIRNNELSISNIKINTNLEIYNLEGKLILRQIVQKDETIKIELPKGIYFYRINEKTGKLALTN
ncbi:MAG: T9SS type A sorting domain-containing protein, partial [Flavobacteriales bacterium]